MVLLIVDDLNICLSFMSIRDVIYCLLIISYRSGVTWFHQLHQRVSRNWIHRPHIQPFVESWIYSTNKRFAQWKSLFSVEITPVIAIESVDELGYSCGDDHIQLLIPIVFGEHLDISWFLMMFSQKFTSFSNHRNSNWDPLPIYHISLIGTPINIDPLH